jgi:hypothetical protein
MDDYNEWMYEEDYEVRYSRIPFTDLKFKWAWPKILG